MRAQTQEQKQHTYTHTHIHTERGKFAHTKPCPNKPVLRQQKTGHVRLPELVFSEVLVLGRETERQREKGTRERERESEKESKTLLS